MDPLPIVIIIILPLASVFPSRILPVYDVRTEERLAFSEEFLKLVLQQQSSSGNNYLIATIEPLDIEGYIINEDGQLVPFKIYKKALHPRNCRGGFHKRLAGEASPRLTNMYELQVLKRKFTKEEKPPSRPQDYGSTENDSLFDAQYPAEIESKPPVLTDSLKLLNKYNKNMLATKYASNEIRTANKPRSQRKRAVDDRVAAFGNTDYNNLGDQNALQRDSDYGQGQFGMQKRPVAAELSAMLSRYPAYKRLIENRLLPLPSLHTDDDASDMFYPIDDTDIYSMTSTS